MNNIGIKFTGNVVIGGNPDSGDVIIRDVYTNREESEFFVGVEMDGMVYAFPLEDFEDELVGIAIVPKRNTQLIEICCKSAERAALRALASA